MRSVLDSKQNAFLFLFSERAFQFKGHTVGALFYGRVAFVCADLNFVERTVIFACAMMCALFNRTGNTFVCFVIHVCHLKIYLPFLAAVIAWTKSGGFMHFFKSYKSLILQK